MFQSLNGENKCNKCQKELDAEKQKLTFDLFRGDSTTFGEMKQNDISTARYNMYNFLPITLFTNFSRSGNLFFLAVSLIMLINTSLSPFDSWIVIFPLGFYTLAYMLKELIFDKAKSKNDQYINNFTTQRGKKKEGSIEERVKWSDLMVGDIVWLKKEDIVPADIILLDSGLVKDRFSICYTDTFSVDGKLVVTLKKSSYLTQLLVTRGRQKNNFTEYRKKLTGKIEYEMPNRRTGVFDGSLKLKKDPKIEQLTWDNFIPRGSIIKQTPWVFGLVVYAGMDTKIYQNSNHARTKKSYIENLTQWLFTFIAFIVGLFSVVSVIVLVARSKDLKFLLKYDPDAANGIRVLSYVILYAQTIPISMYFFVDMITFFNKFQALENNKEYLKINRAETFSDLGQVEYLLLDKTGTLTNGEFQIDMVGFGEEQFYIDHKNLITSLQECKQTSKSLTVKELIQPKQFSQQEGEIQSINPLMEYEFLVPQENNFDFERKDHNMNSNNITKRHMDSQKHSNIKSIVSPVNMELPLQSNRNLYSQIFKPAEERKFHFQNDEFMQNLRHIQPSSLFDSFLRAVMLCHEARPVYYSDDVTYESAAREERVALEFTKLCGYCLERVVVDQETSNLDYTLRLPYDPNYHMTLLGVNAFSYGRRMNSVVVANDLQAVDSIFHSSEGGAVLVCKGDPESMKPLLTLDTQESLEYDQTLKNFRERGVRVYAYASRELTKEQRIAYQKQYQSFKSSLTTQDAQLEQLAVDMECNMSLIGFICFKDQVRSDASDLLKMCHNASITPWLLSGDSQVNVLNASIQCGMINQSTDRGLLIKSTNKTELNSVIRDHLNTMKGEILPRLLNLRDQSTPLQNTEKKNIRRQQTLESTNSTVKGDAYDHMLKYYLMVDGPSFELILQDRYLYKHFCFLACVCRRVIGFNLTPEHKMHMCLIIQEKFPRSPTVMAVGDGYNDALMLQQANIGVELVHLQPHILSNAGDIQVTSLRQLEELILVNGRNAFEKAQNVLHYLFYKGVLLGLPLFYFNWYCTFTGTTLHDSVFIFLYNFVFNIANILVIGVMDEPCFPQVLRQFPALYIDGQRQKKIKLLPFLLRSLVEAFLHATLIFFFSIYVVQTSVNKYGQRSDIDMLSLMIVFSIIIVFNMKTLIACASRIRTVKVVWLSSMFSLMLVVGFVLANSPIRFTRQNLGVTSEEIFTRFDCWMCITYNVIVSLLMSYIVNVVVRPRLYPTLYEFYARYNFEGIDWKYWKNETILKRERKKQLNMSKIVRQVFSSQDTMDSNVQELINPADVKAIDLKLDKFSLKIVNSNIQNKSDANQLHYSVLSFRITYGLVTIAFGLWALFTTLVTYQTPDQQIFSFVRLGIFGFFMMMLIFTYMDRFVKNYYGFSVHVVGLAIIMKAFYDWAINDTTIAMSAVLVCSLATMAHVNLDFLTSIIYVTLYVSQFIVRIVFLYFSVQIATSADTSVADITSISNDDYKLIKFFACTSVIVQVFFIAIILAYTYYMGVKQKRYDFLAKEQIEQESQLSDDILSILVPNFVKTQMAQGKYTMAEAQDDVSILFLYICDFDSIMSVEGKNVVPMLDNLFRLYDNLCVQHGVQKIETVGYTYMAAAGIKACEVGISQHILRTEKTMRLVQLAFDMKKQIAGKVYGPKSTQIDLKVGIHVGRIIAGVIGHHKPQFSLIGDPINYTSRVCSTGQVGAITLSEDAYQKAKSALKYFKKVQVEMKGLGTVENYQVFEERPRGMKQNSLQLKIGRMVEHQRGNQLTYVKFQEESSSFEQNNYKSKISNPILGSTDQNQTQITGVQIIQKIFASHKDFEPRMSLEDELHDDEEMDTPAQEQLLRPNPILLTLPASQSEEHYNQRQLMRRARFSNEMYMLVFFWCVYLFQTIILLSVVKFFNQDYLIVFSTRAIFLLLLLLFSVHHLAYGNRFYQFIYMLIFCYGAFTPSIQSYTTTIPGITTVGVVELMMILIAAGNLSIFNFVQIICITLSGVGSFFVLYGVHGSLTLQYIFFLVVGVLFVYLNKYITMRDQFKSYNNIQNNQARRIQMEDFVSQLLPTHAYNKMKNFNLHDKLDLTDEFDDVSILFADIKGFTAFSNSVQPEAVVTMLRELFTEFDKMCQKYKVYKVYTIGDCYVVLGFINSANRKPALEALNTVQLGLEMVDIIRDVRKRINFPGLDMRIGVHTGKMIGGIIGTSIVRYDIYGQDVSIANKMESNGVEGNIMVSEATKLMLERNKDLPFYFQFHERVKIEKFKVEIDAYLIRAKVEEELQIQPESE